MTIGTHFSDKMSSRNQGVVVADHGAKVEIRVWVNPTSRFHPVTRMVEKRWVHRPFKLSPRQELELAAFA